MTRRYVGSGGNDANAGTSWALRKLTLNGAEDTPVVAGDTVYVGPGTYRETLTCDVSGTNGNPITYIGDYSGVNTDGVGGMVRITGSNNDQTGTRNNLITGTSKNYRTFMGFVCDTNTGSNAMLYNSGGTNWIVQNCSFFGGATNGCSLVRMAGAAGNHLIQYCYFQGRANGYCIWFDHASTYDNSGNIVSDCLFNGQYNGLRIERVGGITLRNSSFINFSNNTIYIVYALSVGQTETVNNCIFSSCVTAMNATTTGEITEDYNTFWGNGTDRTNTSTGTHSISYPPLFDTRWFFELISGKGRMLSPFDLASYSQLVNVAGTSPSSTDMRGTGTVGAQREWGALEYDPALLYRRVMGRQV
jgi:hypothetical protein